jgi:hypothetical protein
MKVIQINKAGQGKPIVWIEAGNFYFLRAIQITFLGTF